MLDQTRLVKSLTIDYYNAHASEYFLKTVRADMHGLYAKFLQFVPEGGRILDAGCGSGRDTRYFLSLDYEVTAIDASEEMVKLSTQFTGQETVLMNFYDLNFQNAFEGIWSMASLLHIPKNHIGDVFRGFTSALKPDGIWCMSFKEGEGERIEGERFFNDYNEITFKALIKKHPTIQIEDICYSTDSIGRQQGWLTIFLRKK